MVLCGLFSFAPPTAAVTLTTMMRGGEEVPPTHHPLLIYIIMLNQDRLEDRLILQRLKGRYGSGQQHFFELSFHMNIHQ